MQPFEHSKLYSLHGCPEQIATPPIIDNSKAQISSDLHLLIETACRVTTKAGMREFSATYLLLTQQELEQGIRSNPAFPPVLMEWLTKDSLASYAAANATAVL